MDERPPPIPDGKSPWQFGVGSMLLFFVASAGVFGFAQALDVGFETAWFAVGVFALAALVANLMRAAQGKTATIYETDSSTDAFLCAQLLREQGISAEIRDGEISCLAGIRHQPSAVVVPVGEAERALALLAEQRGGADPSDDRQLEPPERPSNSGRPDNDFDGGGL